MTVAHALGYCLPSVMPLFEPAILLFAFIIIVLFATGVHQFYQDGATPTYVENATFIEATLLRSASGAIVQHASPFDTNSCKVQRDNAMSCKRESANEFEDLFADPVDFRSKVAVQRQWSLPSCHPTSLELQSKLDATLTDLASERIAKKTAEKAASKAKSTVQQLKQELEAAQNRADSLQVVNGGLERDLDSARSEGPARDIAYENLKASFFAMQRNYTHCRAQLDSASRAVQKLNVRLVKAQAQLEDQHAQQKQGVGTEGHSSQTSSELQL